MADNNKTLTNEDFRKILFTPRPGAQQPDLAQQAKDRQRKKQQQQRAPPPSKKPFRKEGEPVQEGEVDDDTGPSYRDRAAERRLGIDEVHHQQQHQQQSHINADAFSIDDSKYLGGDVDHTHLVKGLDYALLNKVRSEQDSIVGVDDDGDVDDKKPSSAKRRPSAKPQKVSFVGPVGRSIYNIMFNTTTTNAPAQTEASERFLPRRMAYVFSTGNDNASDDAFEVPTTLHRAKEDCPVPPKIVTGGTDAAVLDRLAKIMAYMAMGSSGGGGGGRKKLKKKENSRFPAAAAAAAVKEEAVEVKEEVEVTEKVEDEEDIFADAGTDYVPERRKQSSVGTGGEDIKEVDGGVGRAAAVPYFGAASTKELEASDLPPIAQPMLKTQIVQQQKKVGGDDDDDGYAECYPSYYDDAAAGAMYDDSDDGNGSNDDDAKGATTKEDEEKGGKRGKKGREMDAAKKQALKEKHREETELNRLQKVFEEKGFGNAAAFGTTAASKRKDGDDDDEGDAAPAAVPTKRRKILDA